jgi:hypothetical protein
VCDGACAACAPEAWWVALRSLCGHLQATGAEQPLHLGVALPYAPLASEVWVGAVVDRLLRHVRLTLAAHSPSYRLLGVDWVARYAVGSPRLAISMRLGCEGGGDSGSGGGGGTAPVATAVPAGAAVSVREIAMPSPPPPPPVKELHQDEEEVVVVVGEGKKRLFGGAADEFVSVASIDEQCFGAQLEQATPLEELRLLHSPSRGSHIAVAEITTGGGGVGGFVAYELRVHVGRVLILAVAPAQR